MKKLFSVLLLSVIAVCGGMLLAACVQGNRDGGNGKPGHTHIWSSEFTDDGERHYQTCDGCGEKKYSDHSYGSDDICACGKMKNTKFSLVQESRDSKEYSISQHREYSNGYISIEIPSSYEGHNINKIKDRGFAKLKSLKMAVIAEGITELGEYAFSECPELETVVLPKSIKSIGSGAFSYCPKLKRINFEDAENLTALGSGWFTNCEGLESIKLPLNFTSVPSNTFLNCKSLKNIELHEGITYIGEKAFSGCDSIEDISSFVC